MVETENGEQWVSGEEKRILGEQNFSRSKWTTEVLDKSSTGAIL